MPPSTIPSTSSATSSPGRRFGSSDQKRRRNGKARPPRHDDSPCPCSLRLERLNLTVPGRAILVNDPFEAVVRAADDLPPGVHSHFAAALQRMLGQIAAERGRPPFGTCASCKHLEGDGCCPEGRAPYACGFIGEPLLPEDLDELCINFAPGKPMAMKGSVTGATSR